MKLSRTALFASVIAITALVFGAATLVPTASNENVPSPDAGAGAPPGTTSLEPIVVVATR
jgi:hypothetical protein